MTKSINKIISLICILIISCMICLAQTGKTTVYAATNYWAEPANVKVVNDDILHSLIDSRADGNTRITETVNGTSKSYTLRRETYAPDDRQWEGLPSVVCTGRRIWATWYTGGEGEPRQLNYIVVAYSDDNGATWVDPYIVIDHPDPENQGVNCVVPNLWMDGNDLCLSYIQSYTWVVRFHNPDAIDIANVTHDEPVKLTSSKIHKAPTFIKDADGTELMMIASEQEVGDNHVGTTRISVSADHGKSWTVRSTITSSAAAQRLYPESQIAQASNGDIILLSRLEKGAGGGIEKAVSKDYGKTWSSYEINLEEPFIGPGSKFHIATLSSGNMVMVNHATTSSRSRLYVYLSEDNGVTWNSKIALDERDDVSYPCLNEYNGKLYITWDKGRYNEKEIRLSILTEEDIKAGEIVSKSSYSKLIINKLNPDYKEIVSVETPFEAYQTHAVGTPSADIREKLPTTIKVKDNKGNEYTLTGVWKSSGYKQDVAGTYYFKFATTLPSDLFDTYDTLQVKIVTTPKTQSGGCSGNVLGGAMASLVAIAVVLIKKHERSFN